MKAQRSTACLAMLASALIASGGSSLAQHKTVKQCDAEWQANRAAIQASGKTKKDYVANCRQDAGTAAVQPAGRAATPAGSKPPAAATGAPRTRGTAASSAARQKTAKQCDAEWQANKASIQASGETKQHYMAACRQGGGNAAAQPSGDAASSAASKAQAPADASPTATAEPAPAARARSRAIPPAQATQRSPRGTGQAAAAQFSSVLAAKAHCPTDTVVWVNMDSKVYHFSDSARYGRTKDGAYMCEKDTASAGFRAAKNEKHP